MLSSLIFGGSYAFAAAIQPGPLQAFLLSRVAADGWRRTLPACLAPLISDGPIALVAIFVLGQLSIRAQSVLQMAGGVLLVYFSWTAYRQWRGVAGFGERGAEPHTLTGAVLVNFLNPHPYLGWTLILGPAVYGAWQVHPANAIALIGAFYAVLLGVLAGFVLLVGIVGQVSATRQRALVGISGVVLLCLGVFLVVRAVLVFATP
jgi:threonine/homoserine/homoserine lactone efflux protein